MHDGFTILHQDRLIAFSLEHWFRDEHHWLSLLLNRWIGYHHLLERVQRLVQFGQRRITSSWSHYLLAVLAWQIWHFVLALLWVGVLRLMSMRDYFQRWAPDVLKFVHHFVIPQLLSSYPFHLQFSKLFPHLDLGQRILHELSFHNLHVFVNFFAPLRECFSCSIADKISIILSPFLILLIVF